MADRTVVTPLAPAVRHILRCREAQIAGASQPLGVELPRAAYGTASQDDRHALWLGPDEWLILADAAPFAGHGEWAAIGASFVEVSDRQVGLEVSGPHVEQCLASGCPLDLALAAFPVGAATRTLFHKAEIILWRIAPTRFRIETWRSFAPYVSELLADAAAE